MATKCTFEINGSIVVYLREGESLYEAQERAAETVRKAEANVEDKQMYCQKHESTFYLDCEECISTTQQRVSRQDTQMIRGTMSLVLFMNQPFEPDNS